VASFHLPNMPVIVVNHPHHVKRVLQTNYANYSKDSMAVRMVEPFMGQGLASVANLSTWRRNRRLLQPAFHHKKIQALAGR
jgi:cytochrome P450